MLEGPIGGASFNNEFGRPNLLGYFRTFEQPVDGEQRGYHKPIMIAGGVGNIAADPDSQAAARRWRRAGAAWRARYADRAGRRLGVQHGDGSERRGPRLRFGAAGQCGDPAPGSGSHRPLLGAGRREPDPVDPRRGRGRAVECAAGAGARRRCGRPLRSAQGAERRARHVARAGVVQRSAGALRPRLARGPARRSARCASASAALSRLWAPQPPSMQLVVEDPLFGNQPVDMDLSVLLGKPPKMTRDVRRLWRTLPALRLEQVEPEGGGAARAAAACRGRQDFSHQHRRPHRGRPVQPRPVRRTLAGAGGGCGGNADGVRHLSGRGHGDGRAHAAGAHRRAGLGPDRGRGGDHQYRRCAHRIARGREAVGELDGAGRPPRRRRRSLRYGPGGRLWSCARRWGSASRSAKTPCP